MWPRTSYMSLAAKNIQASSSPLVPGTRVNPTLRSMAATKARPGELYGVMSSDFHQIPNKLLKPFRRVFPIALLYINQAPLKVGG